MSKIIQLSHFLIFLPKRNAVEKLLFPWHDPLSSLCLAVCHSSPSTCGCSSQSHQWLNSGPNTMVWVMHHSSRWDWVKVGSIWISNRPTSSFLVLSGECCLNKAHGIPDSMEHQSAFGAHKLENFPNLYVWFRNAYNQSAAFKRMHGHNFLLYFLCSHRGVH